MFLHPGSFISCFKKRVTVKCAFKMTLEILLHVHINAPCLHVSTGAYRECDSCLCLT